MTMKMTRRRWLGVAAGSLGLGGLGLWRWTQNGAVPPPATTTPEIWNWAHSVQLRPETYHEPETMDALRELIAAGGRAKGWGSGHTFNPIGNTDGKLISLRRMNRLLSVAPDKRSAVVEAGMRMGDLSLALDQHGADVPNHASLGHIAVNGFCTGTHGSGIRNPCIGGTVQAIEIVRPGGQVVTLRRGDELFDAHVIHLGALGIVSKVTFDTTPAWDARQDIFVGMPVADFLANFRAVMAGGEEEAYSVSAFTDYGPTVSEVWVKRRWRDGFTPPRRWLGATLQDRKVHPVIALDPENCTDQGVKCRSFDVLPHFKLGFRPASGNEQHAEYFVGLEDGPAAYRELMKLRDALAGVLMISEVRVVKGSSLWLDPAYGRDSAVFHFSWQNDAPAVLRVLPLIDAALAKFGARIHWGKLFTLTPAVLAGRWPKLRDFRTMARDLDPQGQFRNEFLIQNLGL